MKLLEEQELDGLEVELLQELEVELLLLLQSLSGGLWAMLIPIAHCCLVDISALITSLHPSGGDAGGARCCCCCCYGCSPVSTPHVVEQRRTKSRGAA